MISIIVCSINKYLYSSLSQNIAKTIGVDYELICIDNSDNRHSIFTAYNEGLDKAKGEYICLVHEDIIFHTQNWGEKIMTHLAQSESGIIGVAGRDFTTKTPMPWCNKVLKWKRFFFYIQSNTQKSNTKKQVRKYPKKIDEKLKPVVFLDGLFMSMGRSLADNIRFDENLTGFHGYDYDICLQAIALGKTNYVQYDVLIEHLSTGTFQKSFYDGLIPVFNKWRSFLPIYLDKSIPNNDRYVREMFAIKRLVREMKKYGFSNNIIMAQIEKAERDFLHNKTVSSYYRNKFKLLLWWLKKKVVL